MADTAATQCHKYRVAGVCAPRSQSPHMLTTPISENAARSCLGNQFDNVGRTDDIDWIDIFDTLATIKKEKTRGREDSMERIVRQERAANSWAMSEGLD